jgi:hypothetical protein
MMEPPDGFVWCMGFTDNLNMADDPVLDQFVVLESLCPPPSITLDTFDGFQDIP